MNGEKDSKTTSRSKRRKIRVKKKERKENGIRAKELVSKPHSKAVSSSRFKIDFSEISILTTLSKITRTKETVTDTKTIEINYEKNSLSYECKSYVLYKLHS